VSQCKLTKKPVRIYIYTLNKKIMGTGKLKKAKRSVQKAAFAHAADGGKGHPNKQNHVTNIDSLAAAAKYEVHDKFADAKAKSLADAAERKKHDDTRPKPVPVNDSTGTAPVLPKPVAKPSFKDKVNNFMKMFAKGAGYSNL